MIAPEYYVFTGRERVPRHITHVLIATALNFVPAEAFWDHPNIQEVICHDGVEKIEEMAFCFSSLRRIIMPGVKVIEKSAFNRCRSLTYIECGKLEIIGDDAFSNCTSLSSIDLPSIMIVRDYAFTDCTNLINAKFGENVSLDEWAFDNCPSLERITLPLKDGIMWDETFRQCVNLNHVDLIGGVHETVAALLMEEWKNDMIQEIDSINQILPNTHAGTNCNADIGEKAQAIQTWIRSVLRKIIHYKAKHRCYVNEAAATLQCALPNDIMLKNVLPFLELPPYTFELNEYV